MWQRSDPLATKKYHFQVFFCGEAEGPSLAPPGAEGVGTKQPGCIKKAITNEEE